MRPDHTVLQRRQQSWSWVACGFCGYRAWLTLHFECAVLQPNPSNLWRRARARVCVCVLTRTHALALLQQVYWQWIKPIDACTVDDGYFVGHMLMDISAKNESDLARAIKEFVAKTEMLRDTFVHFGSLVIALLLPWTSDSQVSVETVVSQIPQAVTEAEAECMGLFLLSQLEGAGLQAGSQLTPRLIPSPHRKRSQSPRPSKHRSISPRSSGNEDEGARNGTVVRSVAEFIQQFAALRKLNEYEWFKPMMQTVSSRLTASKPLTRRLSITVLPAALARRGSTGSFKSGQSKVTPAPAGASLTVPIDVKPARPTEAESARRRPTLSERRHTHFEHLEVAREASGASVQPEGPSEFSSVVP